MARSSCPSKLDERDSAAAQVANPPSHALVRILSLEDCSLVSECINDNNALFNLILNNIINTNYHLLQLLRS